MQSNPRSAGIRGFHIWLYVSVCVLALHQKATETLNFVHTPLWRKLEFFLYFFETNEPEVWTFVYMTLWLVLEIILNVLFSLDPDSPPWTYLLLFWCLYQNIFLLANTFDQRENVRLGQSPIGTQMRSISTFFNGAWVYN